VIHRTVLRPGPKTLRASGDRWLFGYADVVTLLFACFAALYAAQATTAADAAAAAPVIQEAKAEPTPTPTPEPVSELTSTPPSTPVDPAPKAWVAEVEALAASEDQVRLELSAANGGTVISLAEAGSFPAGRADLTPAAERVISRLADVLRDQAVTIRVEGHTDDRPIRTSKYESNWELSTARASRVVVFLVKQGGLATDRLSAAGYGEFRPRVPNDSKKDRARNRRVDIVVLDIAPGQAAPVQADYRGVGLRSPDGK
jgi:chemotaxis protein MotB